MRRPIVLCGCGGDYSIRRGVQKQASPGSVFCCGARQRNKCGLESKWEWMMDCGPEKAG
ncbi:hypothetical protein [Desulfatibacillum alkenivorans]|uniref:hypothetical protein n=1 Tax=Desulfatibacillum alkenivorans TaxID=259354 RepID=UPI00147A3FA6|nr:hypothetical protein [Desulfatibacillum alkenivorans]